MLPIFEKLRNPHFLKRGAAVASVLVIGSALYVLLHYEPTQPLDEAQTVRQDGKIRISDQTEMVQTLVYTKCGDEEVYRTRPADNQIGLNYGQLAKAYPNWTIDTFDADQVHITLKVDSYCREHAQHMFLSEKDGFVAVYYGLPGPKAILKEVTDVSLEKIMPQDMEELRKGIVVQSREELMSTLEGLQSR